MQQVAFKNSHPAQGKRKKRQRDEEERKTAPGAEKKRRERERESSYMMNSIRWVTLTQPQHYAVRLQKQ